MSGERTELISVGKQTIEAVAAQETSQRQRLDHLERRIATRKSQVAAQRQLLVGQREQCETALQSAAAVRRAGRRFPLAETLLAARTVRVQAARERVSELDRCATKREAAQQWSQAIEREAGQAALRAEDLSRRFGLTREVPCAGRDLQGQCKLLGDAREAQTLMQEAQGVMRRLANEKSAAQRDLERLNAQWASLKNAPQELAWAEMRDTRARDRSASYARLSAREGEIRQVRARLAEIDRELAALVPSDGLADAETGEERAERRAIDTVLQALATQHDQQVKHYRQMLDRLDASLAALPPAFDACLLADARSALASVRARAALDRQSEELKRQ